MIEHLNDVPTELSLQRFADGVLSQLESDLLERLDHDASREPAEVAAIRRGGGVDRVVLGKLGEELGIRLEIGVELVGQLFGANQDMAGMNLIGRLTDLLAEVVSYELASQ